MIKIEFLEQDLKTINEQRFSHPVPLVQRRMEALWLKSQGLSHKQIVKSSTSGKAGGQGPVKVR